MSDVLLFIAGGMAMGALAYWLCPPAAVVLAVAVLATAVLTAKPGPPDWPPGGP